MIRRLILILAALAMTLGLSLAGAAAASAATPNACPLWANYHLNGPQPHCYGNETPAQKAPYFYWS